MTKLVIEALLWLQIAHHGPTVHAIVHESKRRAIDPLLVVAVIHHETGGTWRRNAKSPTNDYGLMQVHVGTTMNQRYIGRERLLFSVKRNIHIGVRLMYFWRRYHKKHCGNANHHWIGHYNQGSRVYRLSYQTEVLGIYRKLRSALLNKGMACLTWHLLVS